MSEVICEICDCLTSKLKGVCPSCVDKFDDNKQKLFLANQRIKELEDALSIAIDGWERCYAAYDREIDKRPYEDSVNNLKKEQDYKQARKAFEDK